MEIKNKNILITGASGLVGVPAVQKCIAEGANSITAVDIRVSPALQSLADAYSNVHIVQTDLTYLHNCEKLFAEPVDIVLHIAGIKGSPARTANKPADYFFPMMMFNTNMIKASFDANVEWFVYLSSVGVYHPADIMVEHSVKTTMPSKNDWYPGWAKRMGEAALECLQIQYGWNNWTVIRPANIYGVNDNFAEDATVISSNIWKLFNKPGDIVAWGDGSPKRDFVFADDVAQATLDVVKKQINDTINFGCGSSVSIKHTIETIVSCYKDLTNQHRDIVWDTSKPNGDLLRQLCTQKQEQYNIIATTDLRSGISQTIKAVL